MEEQGAKAALLTTNAPFTGLSPSMTAP